MVYAVVAALAVAADVGAEQTHAYALYLLHLAGIDIGVAAGKLGYHLAYDEVEVVAGGTVGQQGRILLFDGLPSTPCIFSR